MGGNECLCLVVYSLHNNNGGEYQFAQKYGWTIYVDRPDHFVTYEDGCYNSNHTEAEVNVKSSLKLILNTI